MYRYRYWYLIIFHIGIGIGIGEFLFFLWVSVNPFSFQRYRYLHWLKRAYRYRYRLNENSISVYHYCTCTSGKTIFGYIYVVDQLLFFIVALIKTFYFGYIFSVILIFFCALLGYFWGRDRVQKLVWSLPYRPITFVFRVLPYFGSIMQFCVWCWWWFPAITQSQPNYSFGCFVVGAVAVVGL